jgi:hypothetical protein
MMMVIEGSVAAERRGLEARWSVRMERGKPEEGTGMRRDHTHPRCVTETRHR